MLTVIIDNRRLKIPAKFEMYLWSQLSIQVTVWKELNLMWLSFAVENFWIFSTHEKFSGQLWIFCFYSLPQIKFKSLKNREWNFARKCILHFKGLSHKKLQGNNFLTLKEFIVTNSPFEKGLNVLLSLLLFLISEFVWNKNTKKQYNPRSLRTSCSALHCPRFLV